ncbi:MAG: hypothetical protein QQN61_07695 [Nitrosopumilus sp.]
MFINTNPQIQTIVEQLCFGAILSENSTKHAIHLGFISIDDAIMTCISSYITMKNKDTISNDFDIWLDLLEKDNKIIVYEKQEIKKYHNIRKNILNQSDIMMIQINKKYIVLLKILLAYLFNFRLSKSDWEKRIKEYKHKLNL